MQNLKFHPQKSSVIYLIPKKFNLSGWNLLVLCDKISIKNSYIFSLSFSVCYVLNSPILQGIAHIFFLINALSIFKKAPQTGNGFQILEIVW